MKKLLILVGLAGAAAASREAQEGRRSRSRTVGRSNRRTEAGSRQGLIRFVVGAGDRRRRPGP